MRRPAVRREGSGLRSLTQVSRQTRAEFYPLYLRNKFILRPSQVQKFFNDVALLADLKTTVTIVIDTTGLGLNTVDILPFLLPTVGQEKDQFQFWCSSYQAGLEETLNKTILQKTE